MAVITSFMAVNLVVELRSGEGSKNSPAALLFKIKGAFGDSNVAHLTPVLTPGVSNDPIESLFGISAPANNGDNMIDTITRLVNDAGLVVKKLGGVNTASDGASGVDFLLHGGLSGDGAVFSNGGVGVFGKSGAGTSFLGEASAGSSNVDGLAGGVH